MKAKIFSFLILSFAIFSVCAESYGPFNRQQTYNYNTGCSNWQSCFGPGINTAGVALVSGLVSAMTAPKIQYVQPQQTTPTVQGYPTQYQNNYGVVQNSRPLYSERQYYQPPAQNYSDYLQVRSQQEYAERSYNHESQSSSKGVFIASFSNQNDLYRTLDRMPECFSRVSSQNNHKVYNLYCPK